MTRYDAVVIGGDGVLSAGAASGSRAVVPGTSAVGTPPFVKVSYVSVALATLWPPFLVCGPTADFGGAERGLKVLVSQPFVDDGQICAAVHQFCRSVVPGLI